MFVEKDRRHEERERRSATSRWLLLGIIFFSLLALGVFGGIGYVVWNHIKYAQNEEEPNRLDQDYLRKLVKQVNDNPNSTWKVGAL